MTQQTFDRKAFQPIALDQTGLRFDLSDDEYPTQVWTVHREYLPLGDDATHFVLVTDGVVAVSHNHRFWQLTKGMFASLPGKCSIDAEIGTALVISRLQYAGLFQVGGPLEEKGRLKYIDGCSDTLLIGPPVVGEPCLNHLHMPPGTNQTQHTHPSSRIGVIMSGHGRCETPGAVVPLVGGMGWFIPTGCEHSFFTTEEALDVVAWHPDTDQGPSHENHPMVNRTYVEGVSASKIDAIRTK